MNLNETSRLRTRTLCTFVLVAAATRLVPHPPNFTAVPAMALFSGVLFDRKWVALLAPLLAMALSDLLLCAFVYGMSALTTVGPMYIAIALTVLAGYRLTRSVRGVVVGAVFATLAFLGITNFFVWACEDLYPRTLAGLGLCYLAAMTYAMNMLASTLLYGISLFLLWQWLERRFPVLASTGRA